MSTPKTCKQVHAGHRAASTDLWNKYRKDMRAAVAAEFPTGTKVKYQHGSKWVRGVVVNSSGTLTDYTAARVLFKNTKTGTLWEKDAYELEHDKD